MPVIDLDTILTHREVDLRNDAGAGSLDAQHLSRLHYVIGLRLAIVDAWSAHHLSQAIALDGQTVRIVVLGDDSTLDLRATFDNDVRQLALELLHDEVELVAAGLVWLDMHLVCAYDAKVLFLDLKLACLKDALLDAFNSDFKL